MMGRCQTYGHWQNGMKMNSDEGQEVFVARRLHRNNPSANCRELKMTTTESTRGQGDRKQDDKGRQRVSFWFVHF